FLSDRSHLIFEYHKLIDKLQEELKGGAKVGTTGRGIGPAYSDKTSRIGIRAGELLNFAEFEKHFRQTVSMLQKMYNFDYDLDAELAQVKAILPRILPLITDSSVMLDSALKAGKTILMEGANGVLLDIDHGTYPFVTSSNASLGGILAGSGIAPSKLTSSIGIMKAYFTRVGSGPFPTELNDALGESIRTAGAEFGATTGRPRRCGWFDAVASRYSQRINGYTAINLTKVDVLNSMPSLKIGVAYKTASGKRLTEFPADLSLLENCEIEYEEMPGWQSDTSAAKTFDDLPENCKKYIQRLEQLIGCPIMFIGTGQSREKMIVR
ncbi:MAG: adenylosuccinate synthetase, partial [Candidatus Gracilibacteria bacterium]